MQEKRNIFAVFTLFFILSLCLFFLSTRNIFGSFRVVGTVLFPLEQVLFRSIRLPGQLFGATSKNTTQDTRIVQAQQSVETATLKADNAALRDQFETEATHSLSLLPARIIGAPAFLPGISLPETLTIDEGQQKGVKVGQAVVYKNNLLGTITQVNASAALVKLVYSSGTSFTAKTTTQALGVVIGQGNGTMVLDNVVLSDQLNLHDEVITSMGEDISTKGYPPGLIVGKIVSIEKNPSNLFQRARVQSLVDVSRLDIIFIVKGTK